LHIKLFNLKKVSQSTSSHGSSDCACNYVKIIDELSLEHDNSIQILLKSRQQEIEFILNENQKLNQQTGRKIKSLSNDYYKFFN